MNSPKANMKNKTLSKNQQDFVSANGNTKFKIVDQIVKIVKKERLDYDGFLYICQQVRKKLHLKQGKKERKLPKVLSNSDLRRFFDVIQSCGNVQHEIMLKLLFYTAIRVSELTMIRVNDLDAEASRIFINHGKGAKDRYVLFPKAFGLVLKAHLQANSKNRFLFETQRCEPFTTRRVQQIVKGYRDKAEISDKIHPHLFRHQMISFLTAQGLSDAQIQLISGHQSKKSLEVYQHISLENVTDDYQRIAKSMDIG